VSPLVIALIVSVGEIDLACLEALRFMLRSGESVDVDSVFW
jgi:hypothetical protein